MPPITEDGVHLPVVERLRTAVRTRPVADTEVSQVQVNLRTDEEKLVAFAPGAAEGIMYDYDYFYPAGARQEDVFRTVGLEMVEVVLGGLSANCVTFGGADTGKTHTLFGSENESGLLQDTVRELFARLEAQAGEHEYHVTLRYWEMSRDGVLDNLADDTYEAINGDGSSGSTTAEVKLSHAVYRDGFGRLYVANVREVDVATYDVFEGLLNMGHKRRLQRGRERYSRWHGFVQLGVMTTDRMRGETCVLRQMTFVHMKGPDRAGARGARGAALRESSAINVSVTLLCAGVIQALEYRNRRAGRAKGVEALHALIRKSESFFMECKFAQIMAQLLCGHEASFVVGCVNPLNYTETVSTLENLQLFRQLACACIPVVTSSEKGLLMRKLRSLEHAFGGADVLDSVYRDSSGRPMTEEEEELLRLRGRIENWATSGSTAGVSATLGGGADGVSVSSRAQLQRKHEEELRQRGRARHMSGDTDGATARSATDDTVPRDRRSPAVGGRGSGKGKSTLTAAAAAGTATHGDRGKIYLNPAKTATYEGQWANGRFDGFGEHIQADFKYRGEFCGGQREGEGTLFIRPAVGQPYRRVYQGEWLGGLRDGRGTQWGDDGSVYEGDFVADRRHGHGRLYTPDGDVVEGSFCDNVVEGWAVLQMSGGDWFEGYWSQGVREGPGVWHFVKKQRSLKGEWSSNVAVMGVFEDDEDKLDDACGGFIPRLALANYEDVLVKQREKLNERRARNFAAKGLTWVDHAMVDGVGRGKEQTTLEMASAGPCASGALAHQRIAGIDIQ